MAQSPSRLQPGREARDQEDQGDTTHESGLILIARPVGGRAMTSNPSALGKEAPAQAPSQALPAGTSRAGAHRGKKLMFLQETKQQAQQLPGFSSSLERCVWNAVCEEQGPRTEQAAGEVVIQA